MLDSSKLTKYKCYHSVHCFYQIELLTAFLAEPHFEICSDTVWRLSDWDHSHTPWFSPIPDYCELHKANFQWLKPFIFLQRFLRFKCLIFTLVAILIGVVASSLTQSMEGLIQAKNDSGYHFWAQEFLCPNFFFNFSVCIDKNSWELKF